MRGLVVASAKVLSIGALLTASLLLSGQNAAAQTVVGATVCSGGASTITIDTPISDSVVAAPSVDISGSVTQASQVEVRVDDAFDSIIPLSTGQTAYSGTVQVPLGTHTIELTAVSVCPGGNGSASVVVTHERAPQTPSTGSDTDTSIDVDQSVQSGETVEQPSAGGLSLPEQFLLPLKNAAEWLNINTNDVRTGELSSMSLGQAVSFTAGAYLLVIGIAPSVAQALASLPVVSSSFAATPLTTRTRYLLRGTRVFGLVLILGALFI